VLAILRGLGLSKESPEVYYQAMRRHCKAGGTKLTPARLAAMAEEVVAADGGSAGEGSSGRPVLEMLVPAFGDRKKITTWIRSQSDT
jgi:hypothetical protein